MIQLSWVISQVEESRVGGLIGGQRGRVVVVGADAVNTGLRLVSCHGGLGPSIPVLTSEPPRRTWR